VARECGRSSPLGGARIAQGSGGEAGRRTAVGVDGIEVALDSRVVPQRRAIHAQRHTEDRELRLELRHLRLQPKDLHPVLALLRVLPVLAGGGLRVLG
jgi:hypothetical protein